MLVSSNATPRPQRTHKPPTIVQVYATKGKGLAVSVRENRSDELCDPVMSVSEVKAWNWIDEGRTGVVDLPAARVRDLE